jgi:hypothetical protein
MGLRAITVYKPESVEPLPYVMSADDAAIFRGLTGGQSGILPVFERFAANKESDNTVRIASGVLSICGRMARIRTGDQETVTIANGTSGNKRHDLIVADYKEDANGEDITLTVLTGTPTTGVPTDPGVIQQDIDGAGTRYQMPLYRVVMDGVSISTITRVAPIIATAAELEEQISARLGPLRVEWIPDTQITIGSGGVAALSHSKGFTSSATYSTNLTISAWPNAKIVRIAHDSGNSCRLVMTEPNGTLLAQGTTVTVRGTLIGY